ncbi:putative membrane protein [Bradyrhizobium sp. JR6.1]
MLYQSRLYGKNWRMHPLHPMLVPFPIACFVGTLVTDITYWRTAEMMWADFSAWLLFAGLIMGGLAAIAGLIDFLGQSPGPRAALCLVAHARQRRCDAARAV